MKLHIKGFILTSEWEENDQSLRLRFSGIGESGPFEILVSPFFPLFFVERNVSLSFSEKLPPFRRQNVPLENFLKNPMDALYFKTQRDLTKTLGLMTKAGISSFEADIRPTERYLMERQIHGEVEILGPATFRDGLWTFINPQIKRGKFTPSFQVLSLDIETGRQGELYSLALHFQGIQEIKHVLMISDCRETKSIPDFGTLDFFSTEKELLQEFIRIFHQLDPDLLIGWNVIGFDLRFLQKKFSQHQLSLLLGRGHSPLALLEREGIVQSAKMKGRLVIDGPTALRGAHFQFENFKLETVAQTLLGKGKDISKTKSTLSDSQYKLDEIDRRFHHDKLSLAKYNLLDATLVLEIFAKTGLLELLFTRTQISGLPMDKSGASMAAFDNLFLPKIHRHGLVAYNKIHHHKREDSLGGHVLEPKVGLHQHVMVMDFKSLYPSIIRTFKIDPLSHLRSDINPMMTPVGIPFSRTEHILPQLIGELMERRKLAIQNHQKALSQNIKIFLNSLYGVMGAIGSRFYRPEIASAITGIGRWVLKTTKDFLTSLGYKVLYGDTDSLFVRFKNEDEWNNFQESGTKISQQINTYLNEKILVDFQVSSYLEIQFVKYYKKFFLPTARNSIGGAKKRYVGFLEQENLEFVGMEFVRSDWTSLSKKFQYELFLRLFTGSDLVDLKNWIRDFILQLQNHHFDDDLVYRKRLTKAPEEYTKNVPPHVKAARQLLEDEGIGRIREIRYVMTLRGPVPVEKSPTDIDYNHYIDKQIKPIAQGVLSLLYHHQDEVEQDPQQGSRLFDELIHGGQTSLF